MKVSVDQTDRTYSAICWRDGELVSGYHYKHKHRTHWHTKKLLAFCSQHLIAQIKAWENMFGMIEEAAIEKNTHFYRMVNRGVNLEWTEKMRDALYDALRTITDVRWVERIEKHRGMARKIRRVDLHGKSQYITTAIMVGIHAGFYGAKQLAPTKGLFDTVQLKQAETEYVQILSKGIKTMDDAQRATELLGIMDMRSPVLDLNDQEYKRIQQKYRNQMAAVKQASDILYKKEHILDEATKERIAAALAKLND